MKKLGSTMFFFGVGSAVLHLINVEFILLMWIDHWGPTVGWIIRGALAIGGGILWLLGKDEGGAAE